MAFKSQNASDRVVGYTQIKMSAMLCALPEDSAAAGLAAGPWGLWCNQLT